MPKKESEEKKKRDSEKIREILTRTFVDKYEFEVHDFTSSLEPYYFWMLDFFKKVGYKVEKTKEEMGASVVSQFFGELSVRKQQFERRGVEILGNVNTVVKSIINLLYDLREFDRKLKIYDDLHKGDKKNKTAARLTLKRIWMDEVDVRKGNASIHVMSSQQGPQFAVLRDAFMIADNQEDLEKMDVQDRTKRILKGRLQEYLKWEEESEKELRQRRKIELAYLKSQVESLRLYSKWARPYLKAAQMISFKEPSINDPELIQAFDQNVIEIILRGKKDYSIKSFIEPGAFPVSYKPPLMKKSPMPTVIEPKVFSESEIKRMSARKGGPIAHSVIEIRFTYRARPTMVSQSQQGGGGAYRQLGKINVEFIGYAMTPEEYSNLKKQEEQEAMKFIEGLTTDSLEGMREELEEYLEEIELSEKDKKKGKKIPILDRFLKTGSSGGGAAFPVFGRSILEKKARELARIKTSEGLFLLYDIFKKAHGFKSFPYPPNLRESTPITINKPPSPIEY